MIALNLALFFWFILFELNAKTRKQRLIFTTLAVVSAIALIIQLLIN